MVDAVCTLLTECRHVSATGGSGSLEGVGEVAADQRHAADLSAADPKPFCTEGRPPHAVPQDRELVDGIVDDMAIQAKNASRAATTTSANIVLLRRFGTSG